MLAFDRRMEILLILKRCITVTRTRLASEFSVSDDTIGRDLIALSRYEPICSKHGRYGGIYLLKQERHEQQYLADDELILLNKLLYSSFCSDCEKAILKRIIHKFAMFQ